MADDQKNVESLPEKEVHKKEDVAPPAKEDDKKEAAAPESHPIQNKFLLGRMWNGKSATGASIARQRNVEPLREEKVHKNEDVAPPGKEDDKKEAAAPESHPIQNIVLLGRTGNGKSATGNSIARQPVFRSKSRASGVTMECKTFRVVTPDGPILNVIDTPGLFDMSVDADVISREIVRCLTLAEGGIHAAILVLSARTRFSKEEEMVLSTLQILFGGKIVDYLIIIFSAGDVLEEDDETLDGYLKDCPEFLKRILILCGQRKIVFDNKTKDDNKKKKQVHELLKLIHLVKEQNSNKPYTDEMYHKIKEENDRHKKEQEELEAKGHSDEQLKELKKELELTREANFKAMTEMMEKNIKMAAEAQEKLFELKEKSQQQLFEQREKSQQQLFELNNRDRMEMQKKLDEMTEQMRLNMEAQMKKGEDGGDDCTIL